MAGIPNNAVYVPNPSAADGRVGTPPATSYFIGSPDQSNIDDCVTYALYDGDVDPSVTDLVFHLEKGGVDIEIDTLLRFSAPNLKQIVGGNYIDFTGAALQEVHFAALESVSAGENIDLSFARALSVMDFPKLVSVGGHLLCADANTIITDIPGFPLLRSVGEGLASTLRISSSSLLANISGFPLLQTVLGVIELQGNQSLINITGFNSLLSVGGYLYAYGNGSLTDISGFQSLTSIGGDLYIDGCPAMTHLTGFSALSTLGGTVVDFSGNSLVASAINKILAILVAANGGTWAATARLNGGGNAAPTGQGIADKATLIGRGATVNTN